MDRGDALQLPPARAGRAHQGWRPGRRRDADGVQHGRDLRRDHDGDEGDEGLAGEPRGDRRFDRADGARLPVRRDRHARGLRQDDPRRRDGACPPRHSGRAALRRLDCSGPLARQGRDDRRRLRGDRRARGGQHDRRGAALARGRSQPGPRRLRRAVHGEHDGLRVRGARHLARRRRDGPGGGRREEHRRREGGGDGHARACRRPAPEQGDHAQLARERDRVRDRVGRLDQRRAAPARGRARGRSRADDRRLRADLVADAAAGRPQAGRALRRHRPLPRRRRARSSSSASTTSACCIATRSRSPAARSARRPTTRTRPTARRSCCRPPRR